MSKSRITDEWGLFTGVPNEFIDNARNLSDQARWLFVLLRRYTNGQTGIAFPSYEFIQEQTGWTPKTIAKAVRDLEENGWLIRRKNFSAPTEYKLVRRHFPEGSNGTSQREVTHFPQGSNALPYGKSNKKEEKTKEREEPTAATPPAKPETAIDDLGDILEDAYPGHATNWRTMGELRELINRLHATQSDVLAFPGWLQRKYPLKANTPFSFKDLFPQMVREANATKPKASPSYCGECNNGWTLTESGAIQCKCQRSTSNENSTNRTSALVSAD